MPTDFFFCLCNHDIIQFLSLKVNSFIVLMQSSFLCAVTAAADVWLIGSSDNAKLYWSNPVLCLHHCCNISVGTRDTRIPKERLEEREADTQRSPLPLPDPQQSLVLCFTPTAVTWMGRSCTEQSQQD